MRTTGGWRTSTDSGNSSLMMLKSGPRWGISPNSLFMCSFQSFLPPSLTLLFNTNTKRVQLSRVSLTNLHQFFYRDIHIYTHTRIDTGVYIYSYTHLYILIYVYKMNIWISLVFSSAAPPRGPKFGYWPFQSPSVSDCDSQPHDWGLPSLILEIGCFNCITPLFPLS